MTKPTLLVAGGSGFIGKYVCAAARRQGYEVTTLGRSNSNDIQLDLRGIFDPPRRVEYDYLINLAAYSDHAAAHGLGKAQVECHAGRIIKSLRDLFFIENRVIHVSSSEVFPDRRNNPLGWARVDDNFDPPHLYGEGKAVQEEWASTFNWNIVRITNVWGEGQPANKAYPTIKRAILTGGTLKDYSGGSQIQWSWVGDVAQELVNLLTNPGMRSVEHVAPCHARTFPQFVDDLASTLQRPTPPIENCQPAGVELGIKPTWRIGGDLLMRTHPSVLDILLGADSLMTGHHPLNPLHLRAAHSRRRPLGPLPDGADVNRFRAEVLEAAPSETRRAVVTQNWVSGA